MVSGPFRDHTGFVNSAVFSPEGWLILSASVNKAIIVWDSHTGAIRLGPLEGHAAQLRLAVFSADSRHIVSCSKDAIILIWDSETGDRVRGSFEGDNIKLSFTDSETLPYIMTPPRSNMPVQVTASSYFFNLENRIIGGVVNFGVGRWLYARRRTESDLGLLIVTYAGQLIVTWLG